MLIIFTNIKNYFKKFEEKSVEPSDFLEYIINFVHFLSIRDILYAWYTKILYCNK